MTSKREKLIELLGRARTATWGKDIPDMQTEDVFVADYLIANGVTFILLQYWQSCCSG